MAAQGFAGNYDQVILAGASLGAVTDKFPDWGRTFRQHLDVAIQLHGVSTRSSSSTIAIAARTK